MRSSFVFLSFFPILFLALRLVLSCRPSVRPSHIIGLIVPANSNRVPSGFGLHPRMHEVFCFVFFFLSVLSFFFFLSPFYPILPFFVQGSFLVLFFGCTHVARLCSWCYLAASDTGSCIAGRYSAVPFAYWYCGAGTVLLDFFLRDVYCSLFCDHGLDFRTIS